MGGVAPAFPFPTTEWHMFVTSMRHVALSEYFSIKKEYSTYRWSGFKAALRRSFRFGYMPGRLGHFPLVAQIACMLSRMLLWPYLGRGVSLDTNICERWIFVFDLTMG